MYECQNGTCDNISINKCCKVCDKECDSRCSDSTDEECTMRITIKEENEI